jgi:hypothetical protein
MDINNLIIPVSTIIVSIIISKFGLNNIYYSMIYGCVMQLLTFAIPMLYEVNYYATINYLIYTFVASCVIALIYYFFFYDRDLVITIYDPKELKIFCDYIDFNKKFYEVSNIDIGDFYDMYEKKMSSDEYISKNTTITSTINKKVKFDDKNLNIIGYYCWKQDVKRETNDKEKLSKTVAIKYVEIHISKKNNVKKIIKKMKKNVEDNKMKKNIVLKYDKLVQYVSESDKNPKYAFCNRIVEFYRGEKKSLEEQEKKYMHTLFHPIKDELWHTIKNNILNPEYFSNNGQIGRVCMLLYGPPGSGKSTLAFRIAMCFYRHILSIDLRHMTRSSLYQIMFNPNDDLDEDYRKIIYLFEEIDVSLNMLRGNSEKTSLNQTNDISVVRAMHDNIALTPRDLLELFQGPVQLEGMIVIATTNKYDEIKDICPELFRPGRLTPIYFGYINAATIQDISQHFFKRKINWRLPEQISVPTSVIISLAMKSENFKYFDINLQKLLQN